VTSPRPPVGEAPVDQAGGRPSKDPRRVIFFPISHLDTQWRWTVRDTISNFLPATLAQHRDRFARFPSYCVNFDGAFRYALIEEYDPAGFAELQRWVAEGRWKVSGAFWDAADVNVPSPESLVRQCLYGKLFFEERLQQSPRDVFLPDCFGFGEHLPIVAAHCGVVGFTTSKLRRGDWMRSSVGIPFPIGVWEGADGSELVAALDPGGYGEPLRLLPTDDPEIVAQIERQSEISGIATAIRYFGVGDKGGAPDAESLEVLERAVGDHSVLETSAQGSDETFRDLYERRAALPRHRGDLLLSEHGTGCYTAHAAMKRCNHDNELLGEAAEKAATAADWLGAMPYPTTDLRQAWERLLWHQFHDDLTGTSLPAAYDISWNDQAIVANRFSEILRHAVGGVARALDTTAQGIPLVVFNPLSRSRTDIVEARIELPKGCRAVTVLGPDHEPCPSQLEIGDDGAVLVVFVARLPALGFAVFDVVVDPSLREPRSDGLDLQEQDNGRYRLRLDDRGDLVELFDHQLGRNLLAGPSRLQLLPNHSTRFPAWEIRYEDLSSPPETHVRGPAESRVLARGAARVILETRRQVRGSTFVQRYRLPSGAAGDRLEIQTLVDWRTRGALLQATFPLAATSPTALLDRGVTAVELAIQRPELYEAPGQQWALQMSEDESWGTAVLSQAKYGWNKPDQETLRLTLLHTPTVGRRFRHQGLLDIGRHEMHWALFGFSGPPRPAVPWAAGEFNQPAMPFVVPPSPGRLGRSWSFLETAGDQVLVRTVKRGERREETIVRLFELTAQASTVTLTTGPGIERAVELDGVETSLEAPGAPAGDETPLKLRRGKLQLTMAPHRPRTLGLRLKANPQPLEPPQGRAIALPHDWTVVSRQGEHCQEGLRQARIGQGICFPGELWPKEIDLHGQQFRLAPPGVHHPQATRCRGQEIALGEVDSETERLYLLVTSDGPSRSSAWSFAGQEESDTSVQYAQIPSATEAIYSWDRVAYARARWLRQLRIEPGFLHRDPLAWVASHTHDRRGRDRPYHLGYLFVIALDLTSTTLTLPDDERILILAATVGANPNDGAIAASQPFGGNLPLGLDS
jgi:alpha-mannosidase